MKKLSVLSLLMCVGSLTLAGCNNGSGGGGKKTTTGGATTSDSGSTGGTSATSGTSGTSGTSSSSGPVVPTDWDDNIKASMQSLLDGVVLPYVPATWTTKSFGPTIPFGVEGDGVTAAAYKLALEDAGYKPSGLINGATYCLEKNSENGVVAVGILSTGETKAGVAATYAAFTDAWTDAQLTSFETAFGEGVTIPFVRGYWTVNSSPSWCTLAAVRRNNGGTTDVIAAFEAAEGWTFKENDAQGNPIYSYATTDGSSLEVNINVYNYATYCDFTYVGPTCAEWSDDDITFMNEQLAGGTIPHPAGLWSHPTLQSGTVFTQEPDATTTVAAIKTVFKEAGFLVAVDPDDANGYIFTKVAPELDEESNEQYIIGWIYTYSGVPTIQAYVDSDPTVTDEFELYASAPSVHTGDSVTLTVNMGNLFTSEDVPQFTVSPADGAELVSSEGNQYVYQINAAVDADVTITASVRDGAYNAFVVIHVEDPSVQTDWEDPILTNMTTALSGHKIPFVAGEWEETTSEAFDYTLRAPVASVEVSAIASALTSAGYSDAGVQEGVQYYTTEVAEGTLYVGYSSNEEYVTLGAYIYSYNAAQAIEDVAAKMNSAGLSVTAHHDEDGHWIGLNFGANYTVDQMKNYVQVLFIPTGFEVSGSWQVDSSQGIDINYILYLKDGVTLRYEVYSYNSNTYLFVTALDA